MPGSGLSASDGRAEADRAMTALRKAIDLGFRVSPAVLRNVAVWNALRSRRDFQELIMDPSMPEDPFARAH
jgi:hypothetical protein